MCNAGSLCFPGFLLRTESVLFIHSCSARYDCLLKNRKRVVSITLSGLRLVDQRQEVHKESTRRLWQTRQDEIGNTHGPLLVLFSPEARECFDGDTGFPPSGV